MIAEYSGTGSLIRKYVYGPGMDNPAMMVRVLGSTQNRYYYYADALGSVRLITDAAGAVKESYTYDPFGRPRVMMSAGADGNWLTEDVATYTLSSILIGNRFMFTGRDWDAYTVLYYYRFRDYSPDLGRFLQTDPIGYADSMNLYQYCGNNPVNWIDPMGLSIWTDALEWTADRIESLENTSFADYTNDVREMLIGESQGLVDVGAGLVDTVAHPIETVKGIGNAVAHPIETAKGIGTSLKCKGEQLIGDDPRAAGRVVGQAAGTAAVFAVGAKTGNAIRTGKEISIGKNFRVAPFGNRTGHPIGRYPHYHRKITGPDGNTIPGGSMNWHRPWEKGW